jgi:hypothetical protein
MRPCMRTAEFARDDIARRLYELSSDHIGTLCRIVERAAIHVKKENSSEIRRKHLARRSMSFQGW